MSTVRVTDRTGFFTTRTGKDSLTPSAVAEIVVFPFLNVSRLPNISKSATFGLLELKLTSISERIKPASSFTSTEIEVDVFTYNLDGV